MYIILLANAVPCAVHTGPSSEARIRTFFYEQLSEHYSPARHIHVLKYYIYTYIYIYYSNNLVCSNFDLMHEALWLKKKYRRCFTAATVYYGICICVTNKSQSVIEIGI